MKKLSERMKGFVPAQTAGIAEESWKNVHVYWINEVTDLEDEYETLKAENELWHDAVDYCSVTNTVHFNHDKIANILEGKE